MRVPSGDHAGAKSSPAGARQIRAVGAVRVDAVDVRGTRAVGMAPRGKGDESDLAVAPGNAAAALRRRDQQGSHRERQCRESAFSHRCPTGERIGDEMALTSAGLTIKSMSLPWADPFAVALSLRHEPELVLLESMAGFGALGRRSYLAARPAEVATDGIAALDRQGDGWWAGWLSYDLGREIERLPDLDRDDLGLPPLALGRFEAWLEFDHAEQQVTAGTARETPAHLLTALRTASAHHGATTCAGQRVA